MKMPQFRLSLSSRGLRIGIALIGGAFVSVPLLRCGSVHASAALIPVSLTAEQTLALYGTNIEGMYWNGSSASSIDFEYIGHTWALGSDYSSSYQDNTLTFGVNAAEYPSDAYPTANIMGGNAANYIRYTDFLIYKADILQLSHPETFDFTVHIDTSIPLHAAKIESTLCWTPDLSRSPSRAEVEQWTSRFGFYGASSADPYTLFYPLGQASSAYYCGAFKTPVELIDVGEAHGYASEQSSLTFCLISASAGSDADNAELIDIGGFSFNSLYAGTQLYPTSYDFSTGLYSDFTTSAFYIMISCPVIYGDYVIGDNSGEIDLSTIEELLASQDSSLEHISENSFVHTTQLISILGKLNDIYNNMLTSGKLDTSLAVQTSSLLSGLQGLFVPSQTDIFNFKLNMETLLQSTFLGMSDAQTLRDQTFIRLANATAAQSVDLPLIDLRSAGVNFAMDARSLQASGLTVQNGKIKVPLRPREQEWHTFYEMAAYAIDIIVTIAFLNMLLNKFRALMVGEKVVELDGD